MCCCKVSLHNEDRTKRTKILIIHSRSDFQQILIVIAVNLVKLCRNISLVPSSDDKQFSYHYKVYVFIDKHVEDDIIIIQAVITIESTPCPILPPGRGVTPVTISCRPRPLCARRTCTSTCDKAR